MTILQHWIPAFAGMTSRTMLFSSQVIPTKAAAFRYPGFFLDLLNNLRVQSSRVMPDLIRHPEGLTHRKETGFRLSPE
jgi:hypothetical protein